MCAHLCVCVKRITYHLVCSPRWKVLNIHILPKTCPHSLVVLSQKSSTQSPQLNNATHTEQDNSCTAAAHSINPSPQAKVHPQLLGLYYADKLDFD